MPTEEKFTPNIEIVEDPGDIRNCKIAFKCSKNWDDLEHLTDVTRHCSTCDQAVYLCTTDAELAEAIRLDHCVAISPDSEFNHTWSTGFVGRVDEE